jgi:hypothetical protein
MCAGFPALNQNGIRSAVGNNMVCIPAGSGWQDQEYHSGNTSSNSGNIIDYKLGPSSKTDPSTTVGTYSISNAGGTGSITYTYTGGSSYTFSVALNGVTIFFCPPGGGAAMETGFVQGGNSLSGPVQCVGSSSSGGV